MKARRLGVLFGGALALVACGGGRVRTADGGSGTGSTTGGATTGGSGGGSTSGSTSGSNGGTPVFNGLIQQGTLLQPVDGGTPTVSYFATASFWPNVGMGGANCGGTASGSCCYAPPSGGGGTAPVGAGLLTFLDGTTALGTLAFDPTNGYGSLATATWKGGDSLSVKAAGDTVHAFQATAAAPASFSGLKPDLTTGSVALSVSKAWTLDWTPGSPATQSVLVLITPSPGQAQQGAITCSPNDSDGTLTVDLSLLANYSSGSTGQVSIQRINAGNGSPDNGSVVYQVSAAVTANATFGP